MAKRKQSLLKDLMRVTTMFPWWVGISLAVVSYFVLRFVAGIQVEQAVGLENMGPYFAKHLIITMSGFLQYLLPAVFVFGAIGSLIQTKKKDSLYGRLKQTPEIQTLTGMNWQQFELLVGKYFEEKGYTVRQLALPGPDGGVDLVAIKDGERYLVQCKQWRSASVGVKVVRELLGVIVANGAVGGFVVASGKFTESAKEFVQGRNIELIDGAIIVNSVGNVPELQVQTDSDSPTCPKCNAGMMLRTAKKGNNAGSQFWGCSSFPKCKGTLSI